VVALSADGAFDVLVRFEGFAAGVREQKSSAAILAREIAQSADELSEAEARAAWNEHASRRTRGNTRVKVSSLPSEMPAVASDVVPALTDALSEDKVIAYPTLGLGFVTGDVGDAGAFARAVVRARQAMARMHGSLVVQELPVSARTAVDVWGAPPAALALMKRVKERFDPDNRLNPGRFVGGL
jgi:glycolate oxidase FAD binding subunit